MSHETQQKFCVQLKEALPSFFRGKRVLDVGSLDVNGNNRYLFQDCEYLGVDVAAGPNVDVVCPVHLMPKDTPPFDTIISTECFEHDLHWEKSLEAIVSLLKAGGLFMFTCAAYGRPEHGTPKSDGGWAAPGLPWPDYYRTLGPAEFESVLAIRTLKPRFYRMVLLDLQGYGLKPCEAGESVLKLPS